MTFTDSHCLTNYKQNQMSVVVDYQEKSSEDLTSDQTSSAPVVPEELQSEGDNQDSSDVPQEEIASNV